MGDESSELLRGLGFRGYRSLWSTDLLVGPLTRVNVLAGQNNAGKSNILRAAQMFLGDARRTRPDWTVAKLPQGQDKPKGWDSEAPEVAIGIERSADSLERLAEKAARRSSLPDRKWFERLAEVLATPAFLMLPEEDLLWFRYQLKSQTADSSGPFALVLSDEQLDQAMIHMERIVVASLNNAVSSTQGGGATADLTRILNFVFPMGAVPPVHTIDAIRQIRPTTDDELPATNNGLGLVARLKEIEAPESAKFDVDRVRFDRIRNFVAEVLTDESIQLMIPHDASTITIVRDGTALPIENLGTGTQELIIIAAAASLVEDSLVCVEEPEIHMHPVMQRRLLHYLNESTTNQYLIATHSAHLLDSPGTSVFHARISEEGTKVSRVSSPDERHDVCSDLGYRPSDLVQANSVIWVEGPSDRVYVRHWLMQTNPELIEGTHYSIMFYGGRLLNHLTVRDPEVEDFISLRRINRETCILIDSDKSGPRKRIGATKKRIKTEFQSGPGFAWITDGYTIENYVPQEILRHAVGEVAPKNYDFCWSGDPWANPLPAHKGIRPDKVAVAREVVREWSPSQWSADRKLSSRIAKLVKFILLANGLG